MLLPCRTTVVLHTWAFAPHRAAPAAPEDFHGAREPLDGDRELLLGTDRAPDARLSGKGGDAEEMVWIL